MSSIPPIQIQADQYLYNQIAKHYITIINISHEFLAERSGTPVSSDNKMATYTSSLDYFTELLECHNDAQVIAFQSLIMHTHLPAAVPSIVDVGCAFGLAGLPFAMMGYNVTFHDFEGVGLEFVRWITGRMNLVNTHVIPYGQPIPRHALALCFDVLEHTGNHLATLKWFKELGDIVAMTYPCRVAYRPPYLKEGLDEWVDDELIVRAIEYRHRVVYKCYQYGWRSLVFLG